MPRVYLVGLAAVFAAMLANSPTSAGSAFVCPDADQIDSADLLAKIKPLLPSDVDLEAPDQLQSAVYTLRAEGVPPGTAVNNLIAAYCPAVAADQSLSDAEKTQRVQRFARKATELIYSQAQ
jgi:hypothetical protein